MVKMDMNMDDLRWITMIDKMTKYRLIKISLLFAFVLTYTLNVEAQEQSISITGKVTDTFGNPLEGVIVNSQNGKNGTSTDLEGNFMLTLTDDSEYLNFRSKGYAAQRLDIGQSGGVLDVTLQYDVHGKDDIVQLGYTSQTRSEISGAVSTVSGEELERAPVANLTQSLPGRLAGLTTQETFSELSRATTDLFIRGLSSARKLGPLVIIDGIPVSYNSNQTLEYISANEIESITLLKDASTQALYGIQGANGVMVITTKRGRKGPVKITTRFDQSMQEVTTRPAFYSSAEYAEMRNQAAFNDGLGENYLFSNEQIEQFRSGNNIHYPNNDWYKRYIKDYASMQRLGVNVTGGNDKVQFYSNVNFMHQGGQFNTEQSRYDPNSNNIWVNYRSNVDMNINKVLKAFVRLSGNVKREHTPGVGNSSVYESIFQLPPTMYGPLTPEFTDTGEVISGGGKVITTERVESPTFGMLNRTGYVNHTVTNTTSQFGLELDMDFLTKGLDLTGIFAYQTNSVGSLRTTQDYERWVRTDDWDELSFTKKGAQINSPLAYDKGHSFYYHLTYHSALNYNREFGKHKVGGMAYMFYQNLTKADLSSPGLLPYNRVSSGLEATYGYDNRYFLKLDVGYSGSEQYARDSRYTVTPAVSAAWVLSNEAFANQIDWMSNLKVRASYGQSANDQTGIARYAYLDHVTVSGGGPIGYLQYIINENQVGNPDIQAEVSTKKNLGIDLGLFNAFSLSVDLFDEKMENMVVGAFATIPLYQGIPLENYPQVNAGEFENKGYEITANYTKHFSSDFSVFVGGMYGYAKNTLIKWNEALRTEDYAYRKWQEGYSFGQEFGYLVDYSNGNGFFNTQSELDNSNMEYAFGEPRLGDLKYQDLNGDQKIDERDKAPIGNGTIPRVTYGISGGITYKNFDLNVLLQGVGSYSTMIGGMGVWETDFDGVYGSLHRSAWTQERFENGEIITYPSLSLGKSVNHESSDYFNYDRSYIRLKNLELGYTLPSAISRRIKSDHVRINVSGQNLLTWDKMKSKDFGPEGDGYSGFPVYRVYNIGLSVQF
jgi:TonB-linked SusC/RagA family outer membrane protein